MTSQDLMEMKTAYLNYEANLGSNYKKEYDRLMSMHAHALFFCAERYLEKKERCACPRVGVKSTDETTTTQNPSIPWETVQDPCHQSTFG